MLFWQNSNDPLSDSYGMIVSRSAETWFHFPLFFSFSFFCYNYMVEWVWDAYDTPYKETEKKKQKNSTCWGIGKTVIDNNVSFSICFKSYWSNSPCSGPESKLNIYTDGFLKIPLLPNYLQSAKTDVISL